MQQPGQEGGRTSDRQYENGRNHGPMSSRSPQNSVLSALPPPMPSRKLGDQPPVGNNVESVITKAKKAAGSLYTLLHAKVRDYPIVLFSQKERTSCFQQRLELSAFSRQVSPSRLCRGQAHVPPPQGKEVEVRLSGLLIALYDCI